MLISGTLWCNTDLHTEAQQTAHRARPLRAMTAVLHSDSHHLRGRTSRLAFLALSLALHGLVLLAPTGQPPAPRPRPQQRSFTVSVVRPKEVPPAPAPQLRKSAAAQNPHRTAAAPVQIPAALPARVSPRGREATVNLNAPAGNNDIPFASYLGHIRARIDSYWQYPSRAQAAGLEGTVTLRFTLRADGTLDSLQVVAPSGQALLDRESVRTVRAAAPFNRFTPDMDLARLNVLATFCYRYSGQ